MGKEEITLKKPNKGKPRGKPIQKGQVLNPYGRPKTGESMAEFTRAFLEENDPERKGERRLELLKEAYNRAFDEEPYSSNWAKLLFERAYGKPQESIDLKANVELSYKVSPRKRDSDE